MTESQYWDGDCELVIYYREADKLRNERMNQQAWVQGMYIYDAIARLSPVLRPFGKKGTKAQPYVDKPYPLDSQETENEEDQKEKANSEKAKRFMEMFMVSNNEKMEKKKLKDKREGETLVGNS